LWTVNKIKPQIASLMTNGQEILTVWRKIYKFSLEEHWEYG